MSISSRRVRTALLASLMAVPFIAGATLATGAAGAAGAKAHTSCGPGCVVVTAKPGVPASSMPGPPTDAHPTKQVITLPLVTGAQSLSVRLQSITPGPKTTPAEQKLCPVKGPGPRCFGQISVFAANFKNYVNRAHPIKIQILAKWKVKVPPLRIFMLEDKGGAPVELAKCRPKPPFNTPCIQGEVVKGSAAHHNLISTDTIFFVGTDPQLGRK